MAGAAYTRPQEASAAVFGNPATLTQFPGVNFNFGAALVILTEIKVETDTTLSADIGGGDINLVGHEDHVSDADNYIVPTLGITLQVSPNLTLGLGLEADAGLGADYRDAPLELFGGVFYDTQQALGAGDSNVGAAALGLNFPLDGPIAAPLLVEVISFNANLAAAYKVTQDLSVGASLTIGFGLAQLGTSGPTTGFDTVSDLVVDSLIPGLGINDGTLDTGPAIGGVLGLTGPQESVLSNWGGTTSSVHDIAFGWTLGATYVVADGITTSLTVKGPVEYKFKNIIYGDPVATGGALVPGNAADGWQHLDIEQPLEVIAGAAFDNVLAPGLLVELDVIWKNWDDADAYQDAYDDQFIIALGAQYTTGAWSLRGGYSWTESILKDNPNSTLGQITGLGNLPLGAGAAALDSSGLIPPAGQIVEALATDFIDIVQMSLLPVLWKHTVTAGVGYNFTDAVSVNAFASYSLPEKESRDLATVAVAGDVALANLGILGSGGVGTGRSSISQDLDSEIFVGLGINVALP